MKKVFIYLLCALFVAFILQPNLGFKPLSGQKKVPTNRTSLAPTTNQSLELKSDPKKSTIGIDVVGDSDQSNQIAWSIAKKLSKRLKQQGYQVFYTRTKDQILSSSERLSIALEKKADLLLSLQLEEESDAQLIGYSLLTQEKKTNITLAKKMADQLESLHYSTFLGLDSDHYENFPILTMQELPAILLEIGYRANEDNQITDETLQDKIATNLTLACIEVIQ